MIPALLSLALASPSTDFTIGMRSRPAGLALFGNVLGTAKKTESLDLGVGGGLGVYFYWYEINAVARATFLDGFLVGTLQVGPEPGWFKRADDRDGPRRFMLRPFGRARLETNVRNDLFWLYVRNTLWSRHRSFEEYNPFQDTVFQQGLEVSFEHSTAVMVSPSGASERKLWFYAEITLETSARGVGWLDRLPRAGIIVEKLTPAVSFDLDFYYSLMKNDIGGPGVLAVVWIVPPKRSSR